MRPLSPVSALRGAALFAFAGVAFGAFGAHALHDRLAQTGLLAAWQTAVLYHLLHAVAMAALCALRPLPAFAWACFAVGILLFSGSLYALALTDVRALGIITPFGGAAFLAGWLRLTWRPPTTPL